MIGRCLPLLNAVVVAAVTGCSGPPPEQTPPDAFAAERRGDFQLTIESDRPHYRTGNVIHVIATLRYEGAGATTIWGSGAGPVGFTVVRVDDGLTPGEPGFRLDCQSHPFRAGDPVTYPFRKSGGFTQNAPNLDFVESYFDDPELHLPTGTWRVIAMTAGSLGECGGPPVSLRVELQIIVTD
jgi:hypothetical protein